MVGASTIILLYLLFYRELLKLARVKDGNRQLASKTSLVDSCIETILVNMDTFCLIAERSGKNPMESLGKPTQIIWIYFLPLQANSYNKHIMCIKII